MLKGIWNHFKTVCKHKRAVYKQCKACGIWWQGVIHDLSKFSPTELITSGKYFQGYRSPIDAEKEEFGYSTVWLHHKGRNKHHWEYWTDFAPDGTIIPAKIPAKYVIEMFCDWIGAGQVYIGKSWTEEDLIKHFNKMRPGRHFHPETEKLVLHLLNIIKYCGLSTFHTFCKLRNYSTTFCNY